MDASCKKSLCMTSYDGIIRIRLIGSKFGYFLSACKHKLPCIYLILYIQFLKIQWVFRKRHKVFNLGAI